ncbi:MAG TPA: class III extradiol dioxygenase subunit B-like domain-containing protein [Micromonosporaceae bacterium]|nr:class III extradiol dioxygenase subunit B-like domain-containing protein [Micromonosporaceae bacterium]
MIVPEIAGAAAAELDDLRAACDAAVGRLLAAEPDVILVVGSGPADHAYRPGARDTFARFGVPLPVRLGGGRDAPGDPHPLPVSLLVGGWLLNRVAAPNIAARSVPETSAVARCRAVGREISQRPEAVAVLVMGDGSACHGEKSPGYDDARAIPYDQTVAAALAGADVDALLSLDSELSAELRAAGRAAWQVLAGAVEAAGGDWLAELAYHAAPYGVAYYVASWQPAPRSGRDGSAGAAAANRRRAT